jgi:hypothetical protein
MSETRRRFYRVQPNFKHNPSDYAFLNEDEALVDGRRVGPHAYHFSSHRHPIYYGNPEMRVKPRIIIARKNKPLDLYGFLPALFISSQAKDLLTALDPDAFEYNECETINRKGEQVTPYWMTAIVRYVEDFDRERSDFITVQEVSEPTDIDYGMAVWQINDLYMKPDLPDDHHAFRISHIGGLIVDQVMVAAVIQNKLKGFKFEPLQEPTPHELKTRAHFDIPQFWLAKVANHA